MELRQLEYFVAVAEETNLHRQKAYGPTSCSKPAPQTAVADLAIRGLGIAILTQSMAANHDHRLKALVLDDIQTPAGLALIDPTQSPAIVPSTRSQGVTNPQPS